MTELLFSWYNRRNKGGVMKTFIRGILTTVLVFTFTLIPTVMYAERTINNDLIGQYFKEEIRRTAIK